MAELRLVNWNVQGDQQTKRRADHIKHMLIALEADVVCLTEGFADNLPDDAPENVLVSALSDWRTEAKGGRKVLLWSRWGWEDADCLGSERLPEGRFVAASTHIAGSALVNVIGVCIPYHAYRTQASWGDRRNTTWRGNIDYLRALREDILSQPRYQQRTIIAGDFNQHIPAKTYPMPHSAAARECKRTFEGYRIATAGDALEPMEKPSVLHIALTADVEAVDVVRIMRFTPDAHEVSDHHGIFLGVEV